MSNYGFTKVDNEKYLELPEEFTHAMIIGETGSGKTTSAIIPFLEDRIKKGYGVLTFDYKGEEHQKIKHLAKKYNRLNDVVMVNSPWGAKINLLSEINLESAIGLIKNIYFTMDSDSMWENLACRYLYDTLNALKQMRIIALIYNEFFPNYVENVPEFSLEEGVMVHENYNDFVDFTVRVYDFYENYINVDLKSIVSHLPKELADEFLENITSPLERAKAILNNFNIKYKNFKGAKRSSGTYSGMDDENRIYSRNVPSIITSCSDLAYNKNFNSNENSLIDLLNSGKIVIVNQEGLAETAFSLLLNGALDNLSRRKAKGKDNPISIFIDEAQKIVNKTMDFHTDVLRESKVEVILSFQNEHLMINEMGENRYLALCQNLTNKFIFRNDRTRFYSDSKNLKAIKDENGLITYNECYDAKNDKIINAKPLFISKNEQLGAEYEFQSLNKVFERFAAGFKEKNYILKYDEKLLSEKFTFIAQNIINYNTKEVKFITSENLTKMRNLTKNLQKFN